MSKTRVTPNVVISRPPAGPSGGVSAPPAPLAPAGDVTRPPEQDALATPANADAVALRSPNTAGEVRPGAASTGSLFGGAVVEAGQQRTSGMDELHAVVKFSSGPEKGSAAIALGLLGDQASAGDIRSLVKFSSGPVRGTAAIALGLLGDQSSAGDIRNLVNFSSGPEKGIAAIALALLGDQSSLDDIRKVVKFSSGPEKGSAAIALALLGDQASADDIRKVVTFSNGPEKGSAAIALALLGGAGKSYGQTRLGPIDARTLVISSLLVPELSLA